jgi:hypothetical protein
MSFDAIAAWFTPSVVNALRWVMLVLVFVVFGAVVILYNRKGRKIRPDPENKPENPNVTWP